MCVVAASPGYPEAPVTGTEITGLAPGGPGEVFCAGVGRDDQGRLVTAGGRVLSAVGGGPTIAAARAEAYARLSSIEFAGMQFRTDIAASAAEP